jgi:hypothetical protein
MVKTNDEGEVVPEDVKEYDFDAMVETLGRFVGAALKQIGAAVVIYVVADTARQVVVSKMTQPPPPPQ